MHVAGYWDMIPEERAAGTVCGMQQAGQKGRREIDAIAAVKEKRRAVSVCSATDGPICLPLLSAGAMGSRVIVWSRDL